MKAQGQAAVENARARGFSLGHVYHEQIEHRPRHERMLLGSVSFFVSFALARAVTHAIRRGVGPFHNFSVGGRHLHHMVFGIGGLLGIGYLWLLLVGTDHQHSRASSRATAVAYGAAAALTLDEFALWLDLEDVYWGERGRISLDAAAAFGGLLSIGLWGAPFVRGALRELKKLTS